MGFWTGRIIGALLGLLLSPIGSLIGFFLGYILVDKPKIIAARAGQAAQAYNAFNYSAGGSSELIALTFGFMGYVARGAGRVNESHIEKAQQYMDAMELDETGRQLAIEAFNRGKAEDFDVQGQIEALKRVSGGNVVITALFIEVQVQIALADGSLQPGEQERLLRIGQYLGFTSNQIMRLISRRFAEMAAERGWGRRYQNAGSGYGSSSGYGYQERSQGYEDYSGGSEQSSVDDDLRHAYEILGVDENASFEEVKKAHKRLMLKYHPDRLASQGLPPEMIKLYTQKAQDIQAAFNLIKEHRQES